jgi:hypothetical protein
MKDSHIVVQQIVEEIHQGWQNQEIVLLKGDKFNKISEWTAATHLHCAS